MGFRRGLCNGFQESRVLIADAVRGNVLGDFRIHGLLVGLIDLDDLFDLPTQIPRQEVAYRFHVLSLSPIHKFSPGSFLMHHGL